VGKYPGNTLVIGHSYSFTVHAWAALDAPAVGKSGIESENAGGVLRAADRMGQELALRPFPASGLLGILDGMTPKRPVF
jgi:hypothetical protein